MQSLLKIILLAAFTLLVACGQRGPLYFPENVESTATETESTN